MELVINNLPMPYFRYSFATTTLPIALELGYLIPAGIRRQYATNFCLIKSYPKKQVSE